MKKIVLKVLQFQAQILLLHWQTTLFAEHIAFEKTLDSTSDNFDKLIEVIQGKYGRIFLGGIDSLVISDYGNLKLNMFILDTETFFTSEIFTCGIEKGRDAEIDNILQEIRGSIDRLKYLLTLK